MNMDETSTYDLRPKAVWNNSIIWVLILYISYQNRHEAHLSIRLNPSGFLSLSLHWIMLHCLTLRRPIMLPAFQKPLTRYHCYLEMSLFAFYCPFCVLYETILVLLKPIRYSFELPSIASYKYLDFSNYFMIICV